MSNQIENVRQIQGPTSPVPVQSETSAVLSMIERVARDPAADMDKMIQLMAWRKEILAEQKRADFDEAMAAAKADIPVINKNREVDFTSAKGRTHYRYEDLAEIARIVSPILGKYGLSYRYRVTSNVNEPVTVTCIVSHRGGHYEEVTLVGGRDDTGGKNAIQQVASTLTYLQRMTLKAALGIAASDDDDGRGASAEPDSITADQAEELRRLLSENGKDEAKFVRWAKAESIEQISAAHYQSCVDAISAKAPTK